MVNYINLSNKYPIIIPKNTKNFYKKFWCHKTSARLHSPYIKSFVGIPAIINGKLDEFIK